MRRYIGADPSYIWYFDAAGGHEGFVLDGDASLEQPLAMLIEAYSSNGDVIEIGGEPYVGIEPDEPCPE